MADYLVRLNSFRFHNRVLYPLFIARVAIGVNYLSTSHNSSLVSDKNCLTRCNIHDISICDAWEIYVFLNHLHIITDEISIFELIARLIATANHITKVKCF